jgi:hypothetical protein
MLDSATGKPARQLPDTGWARSEVCGPVSMTAASEESEGRMAWAWWRGNTSTVVDESTSLDGQTPERETPLCGVGVRVSAVVITEAEPDGLLCHATVVIVDGDSIVLRTVGDLQPDSDAHVTLQWAVESGQRSVDTAVTSTNASTWTLSAIGEVSHLQRRRWVRVPTDIMVQARRRGEETWLAGRTVNLSGGGMSASFEAPNDELFGLDETVDIELGVPGGLLTLTGKVFEVIGDETSSSLRVGFFGAEESCLERLAEYVFKLQREELARRRSESLLLGS